MLLSSMIRSSMTLMILVFTITIWRMVLGMRLQMDRSRVGGCDGGWTLYLTTITLLLTSVLLVS
jgi:hypothetical protein